MSGSARDRRLAELGVLVVVGLWSGNFVVNKAVLGDLPPVAFAAIRFGLSSLVLLTLLRWREGSIGVARRDAATLAFLGILGYGCYQVLWMTALQTIPAGDSALLIAATPILTGLLAVVAGSDTLTPAKVVGAVVAFGGVAVVVGSGGGVDLASSLFGDALTLLAALCWAIYTAWGARLLGRISPLRATTWAIAAGTLFMIPLGAAQLSALPEPGVAVAASFGAILYAGILSAGLPNVVVFHGVKLLGPTRITAYQFLVPAGTVALAAVFLDEAIRPAQVVGGAVIVVGVLITRRAVLLPARLRRAARPIAG